MLNKMVVFGFTVVAGKSLLESVVNNTAVVLIESVEYSGAEAVDKTVVS